MPTARISIALAFTSIIATWAASVGAQPLGPPPPAPPTASPPIAYSAPQTVYRPAPIIMVAGPKELDYASGVPIPPGYHIEQRMRHKLLIGGLVTFASAYFITVLFGDGSDVTGTKSGNASLFIPIAGPFVRIATQSPTEHGPRLDGSGILVLGIEGTAQAVGALLSVVALAVGEDSLVRNDRGTSVRIAPIVDLHVAGLGFAGAM